jgi:hypothetical protein
LGKWGVGEIVLQRLNAPTLSISNAYGLGEFKNWKFLIEPSEDFEPRSKIGVSYTVAENEVVSVQRPETEFFSSS